MRKSGLIPLAAVLAFAFSAFQLEAQSVLTAHTQRPVLDGEARPVGRMPAAQQMQLDLVLPLRDEAGLDALLAGLYDPNSPYYRQFLTVEQFTERFGPSQADYDAVVQFARANGLRVVGGSRHGMDVQVAGSVANVEQAFHVNLRTYQHPTENRTFFAPDAEPVANLRVPLWHVTGLDNFALPKSRLVKRSEVEATANAAGSGGIRAMGAVTANATAGSGPSASFLGSDMRAAYYGGTALTGAGQHLGLIEYYGTNLADVQTYLKNAGQTNTVPINLISTDGTSTACNYTAAGKYCDDGEQTLDITQALGMAPGLASLDVYIGSSDTAILSAMTTHNPLPLTIGCSWGWGADPTVLDPYFKKMAAQGQSFLAASGDSSTWSATNTAWPADDAYVTSVGGTDLVTASAGGAWKSETAWANSGGGISSTKIAIPTWQQASGVITSANKGSLVYRNGPDVAANADFTFYVCQNQQGCTANQYGGTSFAAPMWAAYLALVNQQLAAKGNAPVGFINPTIYSAALSSNYSTYFHDITSGTSGSYSAGTGFDLVTGWGSPNGQGLINLLTGAANTPSFTLTPAAATLSVVQGKSATDGLTTAVLNGFSSAVTLTASGQPTGMTVTFAPASLAAPGSGTSTMTVAAASTVAAGSYTLTVTAAGSNVTKTTTVAVTVTAAPSFTLTASPATLSVAQGTKGTTTLTSAAWNGFTSAVTLTATGAPAGVTLALSASSIATPGTATLTVAAASNATAGSYPITITATGAGVTQTAVVQLTVTPPPTFTVALNPTTLAVAQGKSNTASVTTTALYGFSSAVTFTATGAPAGVTVSFAAASATNAATMTVTAASTAAIGSYSLKVTGSGGGVTQSATLALTVTPPPTFTLAATPTSLSMQQGQSGTVTLATSALNGFNSALTFAAAGAPAGVTVSFGSVSATGTVTMSVAAASTVTPGSSTLTVTASGGGVTKTATVALTVTVAPNFTLTAATPALSVVQGKSVSGTVSTAGVNGFNAAVLLSVSGQPAGVTISFSPASITGTGSSVMTVSVAASVAAGSYPLTLTATSGSLVKTAIVTLTVTGAPTFTLTATPAALSLLQGTSGSVVLAATPQYGFVSAIGYTASGQPAGVTIGFSSAAGTTTNTSSTMTVAVASTVAAGTYNITVTGTGGGIVKTAVVALTVTAAKSFNITASPSTLTIKRGTIGTTSIGATATGGFNSTISLSLALPAGFGAGFSQSSTGTLTLSFLPSPALSTGSYTATLTATGGGITKTVPIQLIVQ